MIINKRTSKAIRRHADTYGYSPTVYVDAPSKEDVVRQIALFDQPLPSPLHNGEIKNQSVVLNYCIKEIYWAESYSVIYFNNPANQRETLFCSLKKLNSGNWKVWSQEECWVKRSSYILVTGEKDAIQFLISELVAYANPHHQQNAA